jgi:hypothetical protein
MSRRIASLAVLLLFLPAARAKDKNKSVLPDFVLRAHTVLVVVNPDASAPLQNPNANRTAQDEVEKAIMRWGRFELTMEPGSADLIISVEKGTGRMVSPTIGGGPADHRPVIVQPTDGNIRIGVRQGHPPDSGPTMGTPNTGPRPGEQIGGSRDTFEVYRGGIDGANALNSTPVWRYVAKDALNAPKVAAVDEFRKAIEEAEKAAAKRKKKQP